MHRCKFGVNKTDSFSSAWSIFGSSPVCQRCSKQPTAFKPTSGMLTVFEKVNSNWLHIIIHRVAISVHFVLWRMVLKMSTFSRVTSIRAPPSIFWLSQPSTSKTSTACLLHMVLIFWSPKIARVGVETSLSNRMFVLVKTRVAYLAKVRIAVKQLA